MVITVKRRKTKNNKNNVDDNYNDAHNDSIDDDHIIILNLLDMLQNKPKGHHFPILKKKMKIITTIIFFLSLIHI